MKIKLYFQTLPMRIAFAAVVVSLAILAGRYWPRSEEGPAPVPAGQCVGLQCAHQADTDKALDAISQTPAK